MNQDQQKDRLEQLLALDPARVAVVLVDFQNDFCNPTIPDGAPPGTKRNAETAHRANDIAAQATDFGVRTIYSQQVLDLERLTPRQRRWEETSTLCMAGTPGAELFVPPVPNSRVITKHRFDIWQSRHFLDTLTDWDIDGLVLGGVELQCCVLYAVLGAEERGYHYIVPQDLVSGMDGCEDTSNRAVRDYFRFAHPSPPAAQELLNGWKERHLQSG